MGTRVMLKLVPGSVPSDKSISTAVSACPMFNATGNEPFDMETLVRSVEGESPQGKVDILSTSLSRAVG